MASTSSLVCADAIDTCDMTLTDLVVLDELDDLVLVLGQRLELELRLSVRQPLAHNLHRLRELLSLRTKDKLE